MLKMVDGTGIIGVDMVCPLGVSTPQPPNYDRVELEGTGMLVLPNSLDAPLERLELGGKTAGKKEVIQAGEFEQGTITAHAGTNYDSNYRVRTKNYINLTSGTYEVTCTGAKLGNVVFYSVENKFEKMLSGTHIPLPIKFTLTENKLVRVLFFNSESTPITPADIKNAILEADASPEHPQDIVNSGKWNEETRKYEVDVKVVGKNLFDVNYFTKNENYQNKDGDATYWKIAKMKVKPNTSYMLSKSKSVTVNGAINSVISYGGALGFNNNVNSVKVTTNDTGILYIMFFYRNEDVNILKELDIQVELGETLTEYEPYKEQTLTLTSDRPITKWDRLVEQGGEIGWLYGGKIIDSYNSEQIDAEYMSSTGSLTVGATVLYKLKTTEFIPLPQSEQNAIRALKTYYPTTVITADGGELDPDIKVTYRKEI